MKRKLENTVGGLKLNLSIPKVDSTEDIQPVKKKRKKKKSKSSDRRGEMIIQSFFGENNFNYLTLKKDHLKRPCWVTPGRLIILETFSPIYTQAQDFLVTIAEPVSRTVLIHEYKINEYSLYAAVAIGLTTHQIISVLSKLSKVILPKSVTDFIIKCTDSYGKIRMLLYKNNFYLESQYSPILKKVTKNNTVASACIFPSRDEKAKDLYDDTVGFLYRFSKTQKSKLVSDLNKSIDRTTRTDDMSDLESQKKFLSDDVLDEIDTGKSATTARFYRVKISPKYVEDVMVACREMNFPLLEEYDYKNDTHLRTLEPFDLKPFCKIRSYQEKSLSKMFGNGNARSGLIVLPCGAGKTLVGITAAQTIKKSIFIVTINTVSVEQWKNELTFWTNIDPKKIIRFSSLTKEEFPKDPKEPCIVITTYSMITKESRHSKISGQVISKIKSRDWGLMVLDEVHVAPASSFRKVIRVVKAHCKLGLTATLLREDRKESDLYYLIGPKHYEANWLDLQAKGHLADVQCIEVWCKMDPEYYAEYLDVEKDLKKKLFYVMNPNKMRACEWLIRYHSELRRDKVIVFSDNIFALQRYAVLFEFPFIFGKTSQNERFKVINKFKNDENENVLFLSSVGDSAIDIPNASVIIQISSHYGSRRQEAQRLGRILRPKDKATVNSAFFYTLVSNDTKEMFYSAKRQRFLIDQGYSFKVISPEKMDELMENPLYKKFLKQSKGDFSKRLLDIVKRAEDKEGTTEIIGEEMKKVRKKRKVKNGFGSFNNLTYYEYNMRNGNSSSSMSGSSKKYQNRHPLFRRRANKKKQKKN